MVNALPWTGGLQSETVESARDQVMQVVRQHFSPEFLNRLDEIVLFNRLSRDNIGPIVDLQVNGASPIPLSPLDARLGSCCGSQSHHCLCVWWNFPFSQPSPSCWRIAVSLWCWSPPPVNCCALWATTPCLGPVQCVVRSSTWC